jgi:DNA helicase-2/ATP-dependent DNA helicase PcrA
MKNHIKNRIKLILLEEVKNRNILTIHGGKGLESEAVFLHTVITPRIQKALLITCKESQAEARVWYVGVTRLKKVLYLVTDAGKITPFPVFLHANETAVFRSGLPPPTKNC